MQPHFVPLEYSRMHHTRLCFLLPSQAVYFWSAVVYTCSLIGVRSLSLASPHQALWLPGTADPYSQQELLLKLSVSGLPSFVTTSFTQSHHPVCGGVHICIYTHVHVWVRLNLRSCRAQVNMRMSFPIFNLFLYKKICAWVFCLHVFLFSFFFS